MLKEAGALLLDPSLRLDLFFFELALLLGFSRQLNLLLSQLAHLAHKALPLVCPDHFGAYGIVPAHALCKKGPSSAVLSRAWLRPSRLPDHLLHYWPQVRLELQLVLLEGLEHFVKLLAGKELAD